MSERSNIEKYYEELIESIAERVLDYDNINEENEIDYINESIDSGLIFYQDQAYVLAHALLQGYIKFYAEFNWDEIYQMLLDDVSEEFHKQKQEIENENN